MSRQFTDGKGRSWVIEITIATVKRVKSALGVDLLDTKKFFEEIANDIEALVDVIYLCATPTTGGDKPDGEQFAEAMSGDALEDASTAFIEAYTDFFPKGKRAILRTAFARGVNIEEKRDAVALRKITMEMDKMLKDVDVVQATFTDPSI